ncbi:hypothetical protein LINGRAHAP2_LOCUS24316 [Linum grandiflorum]
MDESVIQPGSRAAAGDVLHDNAGNLLRVFTCNLGICSITRADYGGAVEGLDLVCVGR